MFGTDKFATVWSVTTAIPAVGAVVFNGLAGLWYDDVEERQEAREAMDHRLHKCYGRECYKGVFLVIVVVNICALLASGKYARYTRRPVTWGKSGIG